MSWPYLREALESGGGGAAERLVWIYLAYSANDYGVADDTVSDIATGTGLSRATVMRATAKLEAACALARMHDAGSGRGGTYQLLRKYESDGPKCEPARHATRGESGIRMIPNRSQNETTTGIRMIPNRSQNETRVKETRGNLESARAGRSEQHLLPEDWQPSVGAFEVGRSLGFCRQEVEAVATWFRHFHVKNANTRKDWNAAFTSKLRKERDRLVEQRTAAPGAASVGVVASRIALVALPGEGPDPEREPQPGIAEKQSSADRDALAADVAALRERAAAAGERARSRR